MTDYLTGVELNHLAELLRTEPDRIAEVVEGLDREDLSRLSSAVSDALFDAMAPLFSRVGKLAPLMPDALVVSAAQRLVPPMVSGRAGGALGLAHQDRVAGILARLPAEYLAAAAPYVDPRVVPHFAPRIDHAVLIAVADKLLERRHYRIGAVFLQYASLDLMPKLEVALTNDLGIVSTLALVSDPGRLDELVRQISPDRRLAIVRTAADDPEALAPTVIVLSCIGRDLSEPLTAALLEADGAVRPRAVEAGVGDLLDGLVARRDAGTVPTR